ncbi:MAG: flagellar motor switch protein FliM [Thiobacillus sp.]
MAENFLSQDEVDALLEGVSDEDAAAETQEEQPGVRPYDLFNQGRIVHGGLPALDTLNERFARQFKTALGTFLRRDVKVSTGPVKIAKYSEFIRNLVVPANLNLVQIKPLRGTAMMVFNSDLVFLMVDNLFGGDGRFQSSIEGRDFTRTEHRIIQRVLAIVFETYAKAWESVHPVEFGFIRSEMNPQFAVIADPNDSVVTITVVIELGEISGDMHICIPYSMIEPIKKQLNGGTPAEVTEVDTTWKRLMRQQLQMAEVEIVADLGTASVNLGDILNMNVGDVISLDIPQSVEAKVDGIPVMECAYGKFNGQYTLRVEKMLSTSPTEQHTGEHHV